jgi:predicted nucleotidyltransferase
MENQKMKNWENIALTPKERTALGKAVELLKARFGIEQVIVFGSKARGESDDYSDLDLLLTGKEPLHWRKEKEVVEALFEIGQEYDVLFSPLFASLEELESGTFPEFPIYKNIMRDGASVL